MIDFLIGLFLATLIVALFTTRLYRLILWYSMNSLTPHSTSTQLLCQTRLQPLKAKYIEHHSYRRFLLDDLFVRCLKNGLTRKICACFVLSD